MGMKIGSGRGKKGDVMVKDRNTGKVSYKMARNIYNFSTEQLEALLANPNCRCKDVPKIKREMARRAA